MFELGTYKTRLYRSSKNDWFGGTEGFYWGDNNAKDLGVRLEENPDPNGASTYVPYVPTNRDLKWQELYREYKGKIDEQFGFMAFHTAPLVSATAMDAKVVTADMASRMMVWADFGKPNQRERLPSKADQEEYAANDGLYTSGYRLISTQPVPAARSTNPRETWIEDPPQQNYGDRLWNGWVLPASDADIWFASGSAAYFDDLDSKDLHNAMAAHWAEYRALSIVADPTPKQRFELETQKGALFLDQLRRNMGDDRFFKLMADFFGAHKTQAGYRAIVLGCRRRQLRVASRQGRARCTWPPISTSASAPRFWCTAPWTDAGANRYAAEELQKHFFRWLESAVPIRKDFEVSDEELRTHDVIFVGRAGEQFGVWPRGRTRSASSPPAACSASPVRITLRKRKALVFAAANPLDRQSYGAGAGGQQRAPNRAADQSGLGTRRNTRSSIPAKKWLPDL